MTALSDARRREIAEHIALLREIVGQKTEPPLWVYVANDQVPKLTAAADALADIETMQRAAFVDGITCVARVLEGRHAEVRRLFEQYA